MARRWVCEGTVTERGVFRVVRVVRVIGRRSTHLVEPPTLVMSAAPAHRFALHRRRRGSWLHTVEHRIISQRPAMRAVSLPDSGAASSVSDYGRTQVPAAGRSDRCDEGAGQVAYRDVAHVAGRDSDGGGLRQRGARTLRR